MEQLYEIKLRGCDANTTFEMKLTEDEAALLKRVSAESERVSENTCMPTLSVSATEQKL